MIHKNLLFITFIPLIIITGVVLTISIGILLIFWLYKKLVQIVLYARFGKDYNGLITGCNAISGMYDTGSGAITVIVEIESNKTIENIYKILYTQIEDFFIDSNVDRKLFSVQKDFMGYKYYHAIHDLTVEEVLDKLNLKLNVTNQDMSEYIEKTLNKPLPRNNKFTWDLHLGTQPIKTGAVNTFMLIIRLHHVLADGLTIYNILSNLLCKLDDNNTAFAQNYSEKMTNNRHVKTEVKYICANTNETKNIIGGDWIHNTSYFVHYSEDNENYVNKISKIKSKFEGVSFFNVLMTAYSASLAEYFLKYTPPNEYIPDKLEMFIPKQNQRKRFAKLCSNVSYQTCSNDYSGFLFKYPIVPTNKIGVEVKNYLIERLHMIKSELEDVFSHLDFQTNYILYSTYGEVLTQKVLRRMLGKKSYTSLMSVLPVGPQLKILNDDIMKNVYFYIPLKSLYGIAFTSITYDGRLHVALRGNRDTMKSYDNVNEILMGFFKYIDVLYEQTEKI